MQAKMLKALGLSNVWVQEAAFAALALIIGFGVLPALIYLAGSTLLGRYDGAAPARIYESVFHGLQEGSLASWIVVLGPYAIYLGLKSLVLWWRASAKLA
jgi:hypothetical protein